MGSCNHLDGQERAGYFAMFLFLLSRDCCVALPRGAMGLSTVCNYSISGILIIFSSLWRDITYPIL